MRRKSPKPDPSRSRSAGALPRVRQRRRRVSSAHISRKDEGRGDELQRLAEEGVQQLMDAAESVAKSSWVKRALRYLIYAFLVFCMLVTVALLSAYWWIEEEDITSWVVEQVERETGGKLTIGASEISVFSGFTLRDVAFHPPQPTNPIGYINGGPVTARPMLRADSLSLRYSAWQLFSGRLRVNHAYLDKPHVAVAYVDGQASYAGIAAYRSQYVAPSAAEPAPKSQKKAKDSGLAVSLAYLFLPFNLVIDDVGWKNLSLEVTSFKNDRLVSKQALEGLSFLCAWNWLGFSSKVRVALHGEQDGRIKWTRESYADSSPRIQQAEFRWHSQASLTDFSQLGLEASLKVERLLDGSQLWRDLDASVSMLTDIDVDRREASIQRFRLALLDAATYEVSGTIAVPDPDFELLRLNLRQDFDARFDRLTHVLEQKFPAVDIGGSLSLKKFEINGDIKPSSIGTDDMVLPYMVGLMQVESMRAVVPSVGLSLDPVDGRLSVSASPAVVGGGSQLDVAFELDAPRSAWSTRVDGDDLTVRVNDFSTKLTTRVQYPRTALPIFKFRAHADEFSAQGSKIDPISVPFDFDVDADFRSKMERASLYARLELVNLIESALSMNCRASCRKLKADSSFDIRALDQVYQLIRPVAQRFVNLRNMPKELSGAFSARLAARGTMPSGQPLALDRFLRNGKGSFSASADLRDVDLRIPRNDFHIEGFNNRLSVEGDMQHQLIQLRQDFDQLRMALEDKAEQSDGKHIFVSNYKLATSFDSGGEKSASLPDRLADLLDVASPTFSAIQKKMEGYQSTVSTDISAGRLDLGQLFPKPINGVEASLKVSQHGLRRLKIEELKATAPEFGIASTVSGQASLSSDLKPRDISLDTRLSISRAQGQALPSDIETSGRLDLTGSLQSTDLDKVVMEAKAKFDRFHMEIPAKKKEEPPLLIVEEMNGQVPLKQIFSVREMSDWAKEKGSSRSSEKQIAEPVPTSAKPDVLATNSEEEQSSLAAAIDVAEDYEQRNRDIVSEQTNRIAIVDYGNVRPFYPGRFPISIRRLVTARLEFTNVEFDIELRQNWFAINHCMLDFLGGRVQADLQFAFDPRPIALRTSVHTTSLDTRKLLRGFPKLRRRARSWSLFSEPYFDGNVHIHYDLRSKNIEGGVEITTIGKEQMKMILYYVDPESKDPTIAQIRRWLLVGEVDRVSVPIKNGNIGLDVGVNVLGAPIPTPSLRGFPLAQFIDNYRKQSVDLSAPGENETDESENDVTH